MPSRPAAQRPPLAPRRSPPSSRGDPLWPRVLLILFIPGLAPFLNKPPSFTLFSSRFSPVVLPILVLQPTHPGFLPHTSGSGCGGGLPLPLPMCSPRADWLRGHWHGRPALTQPTMCGAAAYWEPFSTRLCVPYSHDKFPCSGGQLVARDLEKNSHPEWRVLNKFQTKAISGK